MLCLYQSNRLEYLAAAFAHVHRLQPPAHTWQATQVVVQSQGMRRYLNRFLACEQGIAANLQFSLPAGFAWQLLRRLWPDTPTLNPFQTEVLRWRLLALFHSPAFAQPELALAQHALADYLNSSTQAPYHLAGKLADMFDQYLIYRSDWIAAWQRNERLGLGADEAWQAQLWQYLSTHAGTAHRADLLHALQQSLSPAALPQRIMVFGVAALAPLYLQLLQALAEHTDVHVFAVNPSAEYWGRILPADQLLAQQTTDLSASGHPLLASLGKQGRDFFDALSEMPAVQLEQAIYDEHPTSSSLLAHLQHDIQTLQLPSAHPALSMDGSIQLVSAHSCLRELHILKDQLLQDFAAHPDWQPDDIAVLMPHIEPYLPFIDAVFGQSQEGSQSLPFTIADVRISHQQPLMQLLGKLLDIMRGRFAIDDILPLLDEPPLRARFNLSDGDAATLAAAWVDLGVHWGTDAAMRARYGGNSDRFTWQMARERTVLGWLLPETNTPRTWQNVLPWFGELGQHDIMVRGLALLDTLLTHQRIWQSDADVPTWLHRLRALLCDVADERSLADSAMQQWESALANWLAQTELADFQIPVTADLVAEHVQGFLDSSRQAGFLRGGITFCSMVPMRSLPFRCVCLLGLNDGEFPRTTKAAAFDLIAQHPRPGDRARRDDDRYLFLEAILSARSKLYLSYVGKDIRKNEDLAPSALVYELTDVLAIMTGTTPAEFNRRHIVQHPLQAFSLNYFNGVLHSTRSDYATALNAPIQMAPPFLSTQHPPTAAAAEDEVITLDAWLAFWRNPVQYWLRRQLQWQRPYAQAADIDAEPFTLIDSATVLSAYLQARRSAQPLPSAANAWAHNSQLPEGVLGTSATQACRAAVLALPQRWFDSPPRADALINVCGSGLCLRGTLDQLYADGQLLFTGKAPTAPDKIVLLLRHLLLCAADVPDMTHETHWLYPYAPQALAPIDGAQARQWLQPWLAYYRLGQHQPLPFFAKTSLATATQWLKTRQQNAHEQDYGEAEMATARREYLGGRFNGGQADYAEVAQVFGRDAARPIDMPMFWQLVRELLLPLLTATSMEP